MTSDSELDQRLRSLTRQIVDTAPLPPDLQLDGLETQHSRTDRTRALALLAAAAILVIAVVTFSRDNRPRAVQTAGELRALELVPFGRGGNAVRTPGLPLMTILSTQPENSIRCLSPIDQPGQLCVRVADNEIMASVAQIGQTTTLMIGLPHNTDLAHIEIAGQTIKQRPVQRLCLVAIDDLDSATAASITVIAYDNTGQELARTQPTAPQQPESTPSESTRS